MSKKKHTEPLENQQRGQVMNDNLKKEIKGYISFLNSGSDNAEYLRGQIELAMNLLGYDNDNFDTLYAELKGAVN